MTKWFCQQHSLPWILRNKKQRWPTKEVSKRRNSQRSVKIQTYRRGGCANNDNNILTQSERVRKVQIRTFGVKQSSSGDHDQANTPNTPNTSDKLMPSCRTLSYMSTLSASFNNSNYRWLVVAFVVSKSYESYYQVIGMFVSVSIQSKRGSNAFA